MDDIRTLAADQLAKLVLADREVDERCVRDLMDYFIGTECPKVRLLSWSTIGNYAYNGRRFLDFLDGVGVSRVFELQQQHVLDFFAITPRGCQRSCRGAIGSFLSFVGLRELMPRRRGGRRRAGRKHIPVLSDSDYARVQERLRGYEAQPRARALTCAGLWVGVLTPCRVSEIVTIRGTDLSAECDHLWLPDTKGGDDSVPVAPTLQRVFRQLRRSAGDGYLFPGRGGRGHMDSSSLSKAWLTKIARPLGLGKINFHKLRHSWACAARRDGLDVGKIQAHLRHSAAWMTEHYAHLMAEEVAEVGARVERRILGAGEQPAQLCLGFAATAPSAIVDLTPTQRALLREASSTLHPANAGHVQACEALRRRGLVLRRRGKYRLTELGRMTADAVRGEVGSG